MRSETGEKTGKAVGYIEERMACLPRCLAAWGGEEGAGASDTCTGQCEGDRQGGV